MNRGADSARTPVRALVVTNIPSPYQLALFDAIESRPGVDLRVIYTRDSTPGRQWKRYGAVHHDAVFLRLRFEGFGTYYTSGLIREMRRFAADHVIVCQYYGLPMHLAAWWSRLSGSRTTMWVEPPGVHFAEHPAVGNVGLRRAGRVLALRSLYAACHEIWGVGVWAVRRYHGWRGPEPRNLPYFPDLRPFFSAPNEPKAGQPFTFLYAGKFERRKGIDVALAAIEELIETSPETRARWIFAGDGPLTGAVQSLTERYPGRVSYVGFAQPNHVAKLMHSADVLLYPSRYDGFGVAIIEAMACGLAILSTDAVGAVIDVRSRFGDDLIATVPSGDSQQLVSAMRRAAAQPRKTKAEGERLRDVAIAYDAAVGAEMFERYIMDARTNTGGTWSR